MTDGLLELDRDLLVLNLGGPLGVGGRGLLTGRVEVPEHHVPETGGGNGGVTRAASRDQGGGEGFGVLGDILE